MGKQNRSILPRLEPGESARAFKATDLDGNQVSLDSYRGSYLFLSFQRYAGCPLCNLRLHELAEATPKLKARGVEILAFMESPRESILNSLKDERLPYPIVPDPKLEVYDLYGVGSSWPGYAIGALRLGKMYQALVRRRLPMGKAEGEMALLPAEFLINPAGIVVLPHYGRDIADHLNLNRVIQSATTPAI